MKKRCKFFLNISLFILLSGGAADVYAQIAPGDSLVSRGDSLRAAYRFKEAAEVYSEAAEAIIDSTATVEDSLLKLAISDRILLAENGMSMTGFVYRPTVVAKHLFSLEDFFLYYPLKDRSWRGTPNQLDTVSGLFAKAIYAPADDEIIYYSAEDTDGIRNIYRTIHRDTVWTVPALINEHLTSASDEIYPMLSSDGKSLYFASKGLYGVGGYDLYVSHWDEETSDWSVPVNMGFPYSSPADDFLLAGSEDGRYVLFASNRDCPSDSVYVYVIEEDNMPVRSEVTDPQQLLALARMDLTADATRNDETGEVKSDIPENVDTRRYMDKIAQVRALRDSVSACEQSLEQLREKYLLVENETEKKKIAADILKGEAAIPGFQAKLDVAVRQLQEIEMDFLFSGVVIDPDKLLAEAEREVVGEATGYVFKKMTMGEPLSLEMERIEPKFDYSFRILDTARFAADMTLPEGIAYQIQVFTTSKPASLKSLKGLCPVFETRSPSGRYIYRVGLFNEYSAVLSHLNAVKRLGFRSAYIVGFVDGEELPVSKVRLIEKERKDTPSELYRVVIVPPGGNMDTIAIEGVRQQSGGKDVVRVEKGLAVGPFDNRSQAVALVEFVEVMGYGDANLEVIEN